MTLTSNNLTARPTSGFTLIELLVALTVLSLLMTALLGGLRFGARVWETNNQRLEQNSPLFTTRQFLRRRLEEAMPVVDALQDNQDLKAFVGKQEGLQFASSMPISIGGGVFMIDLFLQQDQSDALQNNLLIRWQKWPRTANNEILDRVILSDVTSMNVSYFGDKDGGRVRTWHESWDGMLLPELVRIDITFPPDDHRDWMPLIVSPMVDDWFNTGVW